MSIREKVTLLKLNTEENLKVFNSSGMIDSSTITLILSGIKFRVIDEHTVRRMRRINFSS